MPYLTVFVAVMLFASSAAAAARACIVDLAGHEHIAVRALDAQGNEHLCPRSDDAVRCLTHCTQIYKGGVQQYSADASALVLAPVPAVFHAPIQAKPKRVVVVLAAPIVGPPLTILFGNFRN